MKLAKSKLRHAYGWHRNPLPNFALRREFRGVPVVFPSKFDLLPFQPVAFDQGQEGSCTANSACGALRELHHVLGTPPDADFSRQLLYWLERKDDGNSPRDDAGSSIAESVHALETYGAALENLWPYDAKHFSKKPTSDVLKAALLNRISGSVLVAQSLQAIKGSIIGRRSVLMGFTVFESFEAREVADTGLMPIPKGSEAVLGGHAVRWIGWDDSIACDDGSTGALRTRNSWSASWGIDGDFWMPYTFALSRNCSDFHQLGLPTMTAPRH